MALLEYENQIFLDAFHEDGLLITARGLGLERILLSFLRLYCDPGNLVLVLNTTLPEEEYFIEQLQNAKTNPLPKVITNEYNSSERRTIYMEGGVLFVTSRILVVDMLINRIPIDLITGILVYKANKIMESCQEAFILRLYREKNKKGFVKAFSNSPQAFTAGFCHVERVMKSLFVRKLFLWPRFQASVVSCFDKNKVDVEELHLHMTPLMVSCQTALLDLIDACIKELKRCNTSLDTDEITVENAITSDFPKIIRHHLDPVWHQLSFKTKQLVSDIKTLALILNFLTQYDCVNFYNLVKSLRTNEKTFGTNSGWLFMDAADSLFVHAKERVYGSSDRKKIAKKGDKGDTSGSSEDPYLEECPKWKALKDVLEEIKEDNIEEDQSLGTNRVLVAAGEDSTCSQIREYLCEGGRHLLLRLYKKTLDLRKSPVKGRDKERRKGRSDKGAERFTLTQMVNLKNTEDEEVYKTKKSTRGFSLTSADAYCDLMPDPVTVLHPLRGSSDPNSLVRTLHEVQPRYVILYDADMTFIRQLEVFKASRPGIPLKVYFLLYSGSTEEQRYLTTLRKEKEAFEYLIKQKATMVIPEDREGRFVDDPELSRDNTPANATTNTRMGGLRSKEAGEKTTRKVIVDMREFRSELPSLIHRRGIDIEPVTLEVGDYILTPDICVERKSVSDLIGSLNNGRLYNQCVSMNRFYKRPVLLIEFDANKSFALEGKRSLSGEISSSDTTSKLTLITLHFPRLRIIWTQSPYATAEVFEELKAGREEPDATKAMTITEDMDSELISEKYSHGPQDMLLKMPGVTRKNVYSILNKVENIAQLVTMSQEELAGVLGSSQQAKLLYAFLHSHQTLSADDSQGKQQSRTKNTLFKNVKKK